MCVSWVQCWPSLLTRHWSAPISVGHITSQITESTKMCQILMRRQTHKKAEEDGWQSWPSELAQKCGQNVSERNGLSERREERSGEEVQMDGFGRHWQWRRWALGFHDLTYDSKPKRKQFSIKTEWLIQSLIRFGRKNVHILTKLLLTEILVTRCQWLWATNRLH